MRKLIILLCCGVCAAQTVNPNTQIARVKVKYVDPDSATNLITQVNALFTSCSNNCQVHIPAGTYTVASGTISMTHPGQSLIGDGMKQVTINYAGTNFLDARLNAGTYAAESSTGAVSGFTLNCSNTAAKCMSGGSWVGFQWGINHDLRIIGPGGPFSSNPVGTSQCLYLQNTFDWYERGSVDLDFEGCAIGLTLDTASGSGTQSYEYNQFNITSTLGLGATGVKIGANAQVEHFRSFHMQFNVGGGGSGAQPVIFDIGANGILNGGDGVIVGEGGSQAYTMAHVRSGGFAQVAGTIFPFASPTYVIDTPGTTSSPWCWGTGCDAGVAYNSAGAPTLTNYPLAGNADVYDIHPAHLGATTSNSGFIEGLLRRESDGRDTAFRAADASLNICDSSHDPFGNLNAITPRFCSDGSGNVFPIGAYQLVGPNGPTNTIFTKSAVAADGDVVLATSTLLVGTFIINFSGPSRIQHVQVEIGAVQFDTGASLFIPVNYSFLNQTVLTNFRVVKDGGGAQQLIATIGNRNAGTQLTVTAYGNAVSTSSLLPGGAVGTTAVANLGRPAVPGIADGCGTWATGVLGSTGSACGSGSSSAWDAITNPAGNQALGMAAHTTTWTYNAATGSGDMVNITDTASNTGTGILVHPHTASGSTEIPFQADANGCGFKIDATGAWVSVGSGCTDPSQLDLTYNTGHAPVPPSATSASFAPDTSGHATFSEAGAAYSRVCTAANGACSGGGVANSTLTVGTGSITANACSTVATITMTGLTTSMTLNVTPTTDVSAVTAWGPGTSGQLYFVIWPSASNTASWYVCNPTGSGLAPGGSTTWNVSAK